MSNDNVVALNDPFLKALINTCGKERVKYFFKHQKGNYHDVLDRACFLVANGILDLGSNDNSTKHRTS